MTHHDKHTLHYLSDERVKALLEMQKRLDEPTIWLSRVKNGRTEPYEVVSINTEPTEEFDLDITNSSHKDFRHFSFQLRYAHNINLVRLDLGPNCKHQNPGQRHMMKGTHLHIWQHALGDTFAQPINDTILRGIDALPTVECLRKFLAFCRIDMCDIDPSILRGEP